MYFAPCSERIALAPNPSTRPRRSHIGNMIRLRKRSYSPPRRPLWTRPAAFISSTPKPARWPRVSTWSQALGA